MPRSSVEDPLKNSNFVVEVDGFARAGFSEVTGLSRKTEVIKYREGGDNAQPRLSAGTTDYDPITLKRGILASSQLGSYDMFSFVLDVHNIQARTFQSKDYRRDIDIVIPDRTGLTATRYRIFNAWPSEWKLGDLNATNNETWVEELVLQNEGLDRVF